MNARFDPLITQFESAEHEEKYNAWLLAKIEKSRSDPRPRVPHDQVVARLKKRRGDMLKNVR